jgi:hypothetical protein
MTLRLALGDDHGCGAQGPVRRVGAADHEQKHWRGSVYGIYD